MTCRKSDLLGALSNYTLHNSTARVDFASEALFHVNGTPRENFVGDLMMTGVDQSTGGSMPAIAAARAYLTRQSRRE